ncbi:Spx/MgsR family RNA polymerase-binding regulatory protein [Estrella lausannensis]|uniref:Uncharacterized protein n=1 Tax=Estrella lausannensis TaxID=483423 RepID=A0A0H5DNZ9_9BACT|nr:Spx/MgsR family RNA polymerase-binding regulatory protein [Estrella lausannensis]CRX37583.1 Conserved hypothetical protein [Estrella lausannensis]
MILYIHMTCSTCKKALSFLERNKITCEVRDIVKHPPSRKELETMLEFQGGNIKKLLNTSGMLYREMGLSAKIASIPTEEVLSLLSQNGMLIKRPFLLAESFGLTGFKEEEWCNRCLSR